METIEILYTCKKCKLIDVELTVPKRQAWQDIRQWMDILAEEIGRDHFKRSRFCRATHVDELKIPVEKVVH